MALFKRPTVAYIKGEFGFYCKCDHKVKADVGDTCQLEAKCSKCNRRYVITIKNSGRVCRIVVDRY